MSARAAKMRNKLGHIKADREQFELKRKELEAEMNKGKHGLAEIQKGLKHHVINVTEEHHDDDGHQSKKHNKLHKNSSRGLHEMSKGSHSHANGSPPANSVSNAAAAIPTAPRISDWCYTGALDSMPPVVKEQNLYETTRLLGRGSFGEVNLAKNKEDNKLFAIKTVLCMESSDLDVALMEVKYLRLNRHACIIDVCDVFLTDKAAKVLHITMSYCEAGDLGVIISTNKKNNSNVLESQILKWMTQVSLALEFCHSNQFIHRDLKPCNVLLSEGGQYVRLGDFGLATEIKKLDAKGGAIQEAGTPLYTAPEVIKCLPYSFPVDCWSFGVMLYELISLSPPFNGNNTTELVRSIVSEDCVPPALPEHYSDELKNLCLSLLNRNHIERPAMVEILENPVFHQKVSLYIPMKEHAMVLYCSGSVLSQMDKYHNYVCDALSIGQGFPWCLSSHASRGACSKILCKIYGSAN